MRNITFDLSTLHEHGSAFFDYLRLRKTFFVDQMGWDVPHNENFEMDQYDNPMAHYSLVVHNGKVLGGARVMSTSSIWGKHTYMMGDAFAGQLENIPSHSMPANVACPEVWEMTRLVISDELTTLADRKECLTLVCNGMIDIAQSNGCRELLGLSSMPLLRVLRQSGFPVDPVGDPYRDPTDGRRYSVMKMEIAQPMHLMAAE